jgi:hypothetical protein
LPEIGLDLHIHLIRGGHRITEIEYFVMNLAGEARSLPRPKGSMEFADVLGIPLSIRALWSELIAKNLYEPNVAVYPVQPGYFLGVRPFADSEATLEAMAEPFHAWLKTQQEDGGYDVITYLRDREDDDIDIPFAESYHAWLAGYASEVESALVGPFMVVDSNEFVSVFSQIADYYGLGVERETGTDTLFVHISGGGLSVRVNLGPLLFRIIHEGYTFQRGIKRHFMDEIRAVSAAAEVLKLIRAALPSYQINVVRGHYLEITDPEGNSFGVVDAIRIGTSYEPRDETEFSALFQELAPGCTPLPITLGRPLSGHLSPIIPRKIA